MKRWWWIVFCGILWQACQSKPSDNPGIHRVAYAQLPPVLDGLSNDACWEKATIYPIDQLWSGKLPHAADYMGRFKITWDSIYLYILAEVYDDSLFHLPEPTQNPPWDEDCLELYIGPPASTSGPVSNQSLYPIYVNAKGVVSSFNGDSLSDASRAGHTAAVHTEHHLSTWELKLSMDQLNPNAGSRNTATGPAGNPQIPFALIYQDHDKSLKTESRMGSVTFKPGPQASSGFITADVLGTLILLPPNHP